VIVDAGQNLVDFQSYSLRDVQILNIDHDHGA